MSPRRLRWSLSSVALFAVGVCVFTARRLEHVQKPAPGQPSMNQLMHRRADTDTDHAKQEKALMERARSLAPDDARHLLAKLEKGNPQDAGAYWTLVRHYEYRADIRDLNALRLWYIEHEPGGNIAPGNINPHLDRPSYQRGKALWLTQLRRPGASPEIYRRAANFLDGADKPLAGSVLEAGQRAYPNDPNWASAFGSHYAQVLLGSAEPLTEFNVFRLVSEHEKQSPYARSLRTQLAGSNDVPVLAQTAIHLVFWGSPSGSCADNAGSAALELAHTYLDRALSIQPKSRLARMTKVQIARTQQGCRAEQLARMSPSELATVSDSDRILFTSMLMRTAWVQQKSNEAAIKARELLEVAARDGNNAPDADAVFEADMVMGKMAMRHGDNKAAVHYLLSAAATPAGDETSLGQFEMNLPRALVDRGERSAVAEFYERMAPKTLRSRQFKAWATEIRNGINPDLIPTFSAEGCSQDPC